MFQDIKYQLDKYVVYFKINLLKKYKFILIYNLIQYMAYTTKKTNP